MNKFSKKLIKLGIGLLLISLSVLAFFGIIHGFFLGLLLIFKYPFHALGVFIFLLGLGYILSKIDKKPLKF